MSAFTDWPNDRDRVEIRILLPVDRTDEMRPLADKVLQGIHDNSVRLFGIREWHAAADYHVVADNTWTPHPKPHLSVVPDPGDGAA